MGANVSTVMIVAALAAGLWWGFSRGRSRALLEVSSVAALVLALATLVAEGVRWQLVPWQVLALAAAAAAALRRWRPGRSRRWRRVAGRGGLVAGLVLGGLALLTAIVPTLPKPSGSHSVGSVTFRWTDNRRAETLTADPSDRRQALGIKSAPSLDEVIARNPEIRSTSRIGHKTTAPLSSQTAALVVPAPTGAFPVGTRSIALTDRARREPEAPRQPRSLVIQLWYPAVAGPRAASYMPSAVAHFLASSAGVKPALLESVKLSATADSVPLTRKGGWPVVLFSPGFGVERELYAGLVEDLASHGYFVVAIDHPRDAGIVEFPDGHVVVASSQMDITAALAVRVADTQFVLTELARLGRSGFFAGRLDLGHVGMFGHSLGGAAAASTMLVDSRIDAGADLDGVLFGAARAGGLARPFMLMSADPGFAADANRAGFWSRLRGPHYAVDVKGAQHFAFSDLVFFAPGLIRANPSAGVRALVGNVDGLATLAAERAYLVAFFDRFLRHEQRPLLARAPGPFAGIRLTIGH